MQEISQSEHFFLPFSLAVHSQAYCGALNERNQVDGNRKGLDWQLD